MKATCLCGGVTITLPSRPDEVTFCNCSLCRKAGAAWSYFPRGALHISGVTQCYLREDVPNPSVELHYCGRCGVTTHWTATLASGRDRMGVNMRLFAPEELAGMRAQYIDGAGWDGTSPPEHLRSSGVIGEDAFIS